MHNGRQIHMEEINDIVKRIQALDPQTQECVLSFLDVLITIQNAAE